MSNEINYHSGAAIIIWDGKGFRSKKQLEDIIDSSGINESEIEINYMHSSPYEEEPLHSLARFKDNLSRILDDVNEKIESIKLRELEND